MLSFLIFLIPSFLLGQLPSTEPLVSSMTLDEKIGQILMAACYCDPHFEFQETQSKTYMEELQKLIEKGFVGGVAFVGPSNICEQVRLTNHIQSLSPFPLLIAQDLEWGLGM